MCFYHEYDWFSESQTKLENVATKDIKCNECRTMIPAGEIYHYLWQQEYECCYLCTEGDCECPKDKDGDCIQCQCEEPEFGETCEWHCCSDCWKFLQAIEQAEKEAGCAQDESRPALFEMINDLLEFPIEERERCISKAMIMYPELISNGYIGKMESRLNLKD